MYIIVAVVHHIRLEIGVVQFPGLCRNKRQICRERVATLPFAWLRNEIVCWVVVWLFHFVPLLVGCRVGVVAQSGFYRLRLACFLFLLGLLQAFYLGFRHIVVAHQHHVVDGRRNFKTVFVFHQNYLVTLETRDGATSNFAQKSNLIAYFHFLYLLLRLL